MIGCPGQGTTARMKYEVCALLFLKTYTNDFACAILPPPRPFPKAMLKQTATFFNILRDCH